MTQGNDVTLEGGIITDFPFRFWLDVVQIKRLLVDGVFILARDVDSLLIQKLPKQSIESVGIYFQIFPHSRA